MSSKFLLSILVVVAVSHVSVAIAQVFPTSFQASIDNGDFTDPILALSSPSFQRYDYFDTSDDTLMHLLRYSIRGDSGNEFTRVTETDGTDGPFRLESITTQTLFSGDAWLSLQNEYNLPSDFNPMPHQMTLYTEQVVPGRSLSREDISLTLSTDALLAGTGSFLNSIDGSRPGINNGLDSDGPFICLGDGCFGGAEFNLLNVSYTEDGDVVRAGFLGFPPDFPFFGSPGLPTLSPPIEGQLLYSEFTSQPGGFVGTFDQRSNFIVGSVPEPGSGMILFLSAALTLLHSRKRRLLV